MTREELLEALLVERFQPTIPSDRTELAPNAAEIERRRTEAVNEVAPLRLVSDNTRRTA